MDPNNNQEDFDQMCATLSARIRVLMTVYRRWVTRSQNSVNDLAALNWFLYQLLDEFSNKTKPNCCRLLELETAQSYRYEVFRSVVDRLGLPNLVLGGLDNQLTDQGLTVPTSVEQFLSLMFTVCNDFKQRFGGSGASHFFFQRKGFRSFTLQTINDITRIMVRAHSKLQVLYYGSLRK